MDPNETLRQLRELMSTPLLRNTEEYGAWIDQVTVKIEALDEWLSNGGFLPAAWER